MRLPPIISYLKHLRWHPSFNIAEKGGDAYENRLEKLASFQQKILKHAMRCKLRITFEVRETNLLSDHPPMCHSSLSSAFLRQSLTSRKLCIQHAVYTRLRTRGLSNTSSPLKSANLGIFDWPPKMRFCLPGRGVVFLRS